MKTISKIIVLFLLVYLSMLIPEQKASAQGVSVNFQLFYNNLSPYGRWIDYPAYGRCWIPRVAVGFRPYYSKGHWVYADIGWTWVSGYPWGWAPFHYGRWMLDPSYGWLWVPGMEWGPAWVSWRHAEGFYGWAPLGPGVSINIALGAGYVIPHDRWVFVEDRYIGDPHINRHFIGPERNPGIINRSTVIGNTYVDKRNHVSYIAGPNRTDVERVTANRITPVAIHENNSPGQKYNNGHLWIYKPDMQNSKINSTTPSTGNISSTGNGNRINRTGQAVQSGKPARVNNNTINRTHSGRLNGSISGNRGRR
ncbi:MAG: DUF6600 domain-containing protein [FCB group bacterium]|jgi:hypothetical protein